MKWNKIGRGHGGRDAPSLDSVNCLHSNTDNQSLGINLELYCYTDREYKNRDELQP